MGISIIVSTFIAISNRANESIAQDEANFWENRVFWSPESGQIKIFSEPLSFFGLPAFSAPLSAQTAPLTAPL